MPTAFALLGDLLKKKPDVPKLKPIDPNLEAAQAVQGNLDNFAKIRELGGIFNKANLENFNSLLPQGARGLIENNILSALRGEIPQDVSDQVIRRGAEAATAGGFGGSIFGRNLTLRDLGLTSLQRSDMGLDMATQWLSLQPPQFNFGSMFVSPEMQLQQANLDRDAIFQRDWMKNQLDAAYNPWTIVGENTIKYDNQMSAWADMAVASYLGTSVPSYGGGGGGGFTQQDGINMGANAGSFGAYGAAGGGSGGSAGGGGGIMSMFGGMFGGGGGSGASAGAAASMFSDVNMKKNFEAIDEDELADKLASLPVSKWHYRSEHDDDPKRIGPMAQDFNPLVGKGDEREIEFQDAIGVLLAAVKSLSKRVQQLEAAHG